MTQLFLAQEYWSAALAPHAPLEEFNNQLGREIMKGSVDFENQFFTSAFPDVIMNVEIDAAGLWKGRHWSWRNDEGITPGSGT